MNETATSGAAAIEAPTLRRALNLPLLFLYGLGVTIGAGIYVLIGVTAQRAGIYAPVSFVVAAFVMAFSAASYAELAGRLPVSAGEAAYVREGFGSRILSTLVGLFVILTGVLSSATISVGSTGYLGQFIDVPPAILVVAFVLAVGLISAWGILESVLVAGLITVFAIAGLVAIIVLGLWTDPATLIELPVYLTPPFEFAVWSGIGAASLLTFYAFIGFEDLVNVAEEAKNPERTLPWAIFLTLAITTLLYVLVCVVALRIATPEELGRASAPMSLIFQRLAGPDPIIIGGIALLAVTNTAIVQIIMASRVFYGLASRGDMPGILSRVSAVTRTPLVATGLVVAMVLALALAFPLAGLAEMTSRVMLLVFALVNGSLLMLKLRGVPAPEGAVKVPLWVPALGALLCILFFLASLLSRL